MTRLRVSEQDLRCERVEGTGGSSSKNTGTLDGVVRVTIWAGTSEVTVRLEMLRQYAARGAVRTRQTPSIH